MGAEMMRTELDEIRADVMAQPPADRLEYALDLLAYYLEPAPVFFDLCPRHGLNLSRIEVRALWCLWQARGRLVTRDRLLSVISLDPAQAGEISASQPYRSIYRLRREIRAAGLPIKIRGIYGEGYQLHAAPHFDFGLARAGAARPAPARAR